MKPKSAVWKFFAKTTKNGKEMYECKYCLKEYGCKNATKFGKHISKCIRCPYEIKTMFVKVKSTKFESDSFQKNSETDIIMDNCASSASHMSLCSQSSSVGRNTSAATTLSSFMDCITKEEQVFCLHSTFSKSFPLPFLFFFYR